MHVMCVSELGNLLAFCCTDWGDGLRKVRTREFYILSRPAGSSGGKPGRIKSPYVVEEKGRRDGQPAAEVQYGRSLSGSFQLTIKFNLTVEAGFRAKGSHDGVTGQLSATKRCPGLLWAVRLR
jgi:hypothetical protein